MKPTILLLPIIVVASTLFACVAPPPTPASPVAAGPATPAVSCAGSDTFLGKVSVLGLPYWPDPNTDIYQRPQPVPPNATVTNPNILEDLAGAFCSANQKVKNDLLSLK